MSSSDSTQRAALASPANLRARALSGEMLFGCQIAGDAPWLVDLAALAGFDFAALDLEHEPISVSQAAQFIRACDSAGIPSVVRVPLGHRIEPMLNAGVSGIMVPGVNSLRDARHLVDVTRYHPLGRRGFSSSVRSVDYSLRGDVQAAFARANDSVFVIAMIEDHSALHELDEILATPGIDAIRVGPGDLAQSMGFPAAKDVARATHEIVRRVVAAGRVAGMGGYVGHPDGAVAGVARLREQRDLGVTLYLVILNRIIGQGLVELRRALDSVSDR